MKGIQNATKRVFCLFMIFAFILFGISQNSVICLGKPDESKKMDYKNLIKKSEAKEIANLHLDAAEDHMDGKRTKGNKWSDKTQISKTYPVYDTEEKLCAYAFELKDSGEDAGYIVVGANEEYSPVIEYATSGKFYDGELKASEYLLYDGTIGYYKTSKESDVVVDINDKNQKYRKVKQKIQRKKHEEEWENISEQLTYVASSTPPNSGGEITNPGAYESGYVSVNRGGATNYDRVMYFSTSDFPNYDKHCSPTAATNLLLYWNERKTLKVSLMKNSWPETFSTLFSYFKTTLERGTSPSNVKPGLERYLDEIGVATDVVSHWDIRSTNWTEMKYRLDFGEPFIYLMTDHYLYTSHAVLALAYTEYVYSSKQFVTDSKYSRYLCVADGWTKLANRYVNVSVGSDFSQDEMVTLYFVGKY